MFVFIVHLRLSIFIIILFLLSIQKRGNRLLAYLHIWKQIYLSTNPYMRYRNGPSECYWRNNRDVEIFPHFQKHLPKLVFFFSNNVIFVFVTWFLYVAEQLLHIYCYRKFGNFGNVWFHEEMIFFELSFHPLVIYNF